MEKPNPIFPLFFFYLFYFVSRTFADSPNASAPIPPQPDTFPGLITNQFQPSMAVVVIVLITTLVFVGFFSIYIRQCADDDESEAQGAYRRGGGGGGNRAGIDPTVVKSFPTFVYSDVRSLKIGKGALECAVCLSEFEDDELLRLMPKCCHVFHPDCIDAWLTAHVTCPVCRTNLSVDSDNIAALCQACLAAQYTVQNQEQDPSVRTQPPESDEVPITVEPVKQLPENRPPRKKGRQIRGKFPRSHSTGHSLVLLGDHERFTLRLTDEVKKQMIAGKFNRASSSANLAAMGFEGSSRGGCRLCGEGSNRGRVCGESSNRGLADRVVDGAKSERWTFPRAPPSVLRTFSFGSIQSGGRPEGEPAAGSGLWPCLWSPLTPVLTKRDTENRAYATPPPV